MVALKPLHDKARIKRVVVATYQSVSGAGKDAMDELDRQTKAIYSLQEIEAKKFPKRIAFNVIPHIDVFMEDGYTKEEWKMVVETKKILDPKIKLTATCVRVPVFIGHSEAVNIEFEEPITPEEAREILRMRARLHRDRQARARRLRHARTRSRARTRPTSAASARTRRSRTACRCGWSPTTCARARRSTPCRSPSADQPQADPGQAEGGVGGSDSVVLAEAR